MKADPLSITENRVTKYVDRETDEVLATVSPWLGGWLAEKRGCDPVFFSHSADAHYHAA